MVWPSVRAWLGKALLGMPAAVVLLDNTFYAAVVQGDSMQPLLNPADGRDDRDIVLLSRLRHRSFPYTRGDVVVVTSPRDPTSMMIKRVIGIAGDTVFAQPRFTGDRLVLVPRGHCWMEGDNATCSLDSNIHGPVPVGLIAAKAIAVIWPPRRCKWLQQYYPKDRVVEPMHSIVVDEDEDEDEDEEDGLDHDDLYFV